MFSKPWKFYSHLGFNPDHNVVLNENISKGKSLRNVNRRRMFSWSITCHRMIQESYMWVRPPTCDLGFYVYKT